MRVRDPCMLQAMEPFFSVLLSAIFLGDRPTLAVVAALLPIVGGGLLVLHCTCCCSSELPL